MTMPGEGFKVASGYVEITGKVDRSDINRGAREAGRDYSDAFTSSSTDAMRSHRDAFAREGQYAGSRYGDGFSRDIFGRLHDTLGRYAKEGEEAGRRYGDGFRRNGRSNIGQFAREASTALGQIGQLGGGIMALTSPLFSLVGLVAMASPLIVGLAASLGLAGAAAGAAIPAMIGLGSVIGTIMAAFSGVTKALKAYTQQQAQAGSGAGKSAAQQRAAAEQIRSAQEAVDDARRNQARVYRNTQEQIAQAERSVQEALADTRQAQLDLNQARIDAVKIMDDVADAARDAALDETAARLRLQRAEIAYQQVMSDPTATDLDRAEAALDLARAQAALSDAIEDNTQAQEDLNDSNSKGVEGSDTVVAAKQRQQEAEQRLADAQADLAKTQRDAAEAQEDAARQVSRALHQLELAQLSANEAMGAGAGAANAFAAEMKKLTPQGRAFVQTMIQFKQVYSGLRQTAERTFLPGVTSFLTSAITLFPVINQHIGNMGTQLGEAARRVGDLIRTPLFQGKLSSIFREVEASAGAFSRSVGPGVDILVTLGQAAAPLLTRVSDALANWTINLDGLLQRKSETGELQSFFQRAGDELAKWWRIFSNITVGIANVMRAALPVGQAMASGLERITARFREWSGTEKAQQQIREFFAAFARIDVGQLLGIAAAIGAIGLAAKGIGAGAGLVTLVTTLVGLGTVGWVIAAVAAGLVAMGGAIAFAYTQSAPFRQLINEIGGLLADVFLPLLRQAGAVIQEYLVPIFTMFANTMLPILHDGIKKITDAYRDNQDQINQLQGWLKQFADFVMTYVMPILMTFIGFIATTVVDTIVVLINIIGAAIRIVNTFGQGFKQLRDTAASVASTIRQTWDSLVGWFTGLPGRINKATGGMWDGIRNSFRSAINWVIDRWNGLRFSLTIPESILGIPIPGGGRTASFGTPDIPRLARGGLVRQGGLAMVADRFGKDGEIVSLPTGAKVTPLSDSDRAGSKIEQLTVVVQGVWDFTDPGAARKIVAQMYEELKNYEKEHRR